MAKVFLSASDQCENAYAYGDTNEAEICRKIADVCEIALKRFGFEVKNSKTNSYVERTRESNAWGESSPYFYTYEHGVCACFWN